MLDLSLIEGEHGDFLLTIVLRVVILGDDLCYLYLSNIFIFLYKLRYFLYIF